MKWYNRIFKHTDGIDVTDWNSDIKKWKNLSTDDAKFIFAQAEKLLDDTIKNFDATTTKSLSILTILNGLVVAQVAYFFLNFDPNGIFSEKLTTIFLGTVYLLHTTLHIVKNILPNTYKVIGSPPDRLFVSMFIDSELPKEIIRTAQIYRNEIVDYNKRIYYNMAVNELRLTHFTAAVIKLMLYPIITLLIYFGLVGIKYLCSIPT